MRNIARIIDGWHNSFALIGFCLSVAFLIVLTGILHSALAFHPCCFAHDMRGRLGLFLVDPLFV